MNTTLIADSAWYCDLEYMGVEHLIATGMLDTEEGLLLVDPGPATTLEALQTVLNEAGYGWDDVAGLLLTHIHLDHAGAAGSIVEQAPHAQVYVHRRGAPHLTAPERLIRSAKRIYGDMMEELWGEIRAVPEDNVHALTGGEKLNLGGRTLRVAYTPGHAVHHVSYFDAATETAFIGDVGGLRIAGADYVLPVAPPPDVELERWHESIDRIRDWEPERIFVTHFGAFDDVERHLRDMEMRLDAFAETVRADLTTDEDPSVLANRFHADQVEAMKAATPEPLQLPYEHFGRPKESWHGLARYWRQHA